MSIKEIPWDEFPEATHALYNHPAHYDFLAYKKGNAWMLLFPKPTPWQPKSWFESTMPANTVSKLVQRPSKSETARDKEYEIEDLFEVVYYAQTRLKIHEVIDVANALYEAGFRKTEGED